MTTKKEQILNLYKKFKEDINKNVNDDKLNKLFPNEEEKTFDIVQLVGLMDVFFYDENQYEQSIKYILCLYDITLNAEIFDKIKISIIDFIKEIKKVCA